MRLKLLNSLSIVLLHLFIVALAMNCFYLWTVFLATIFYIIAVTYLLRQSTGSKTTVLFALAYVTMLLFFSAIGFHYRASITTLIGFLFPLFIVISPFTGLQYLSFLPDKILNLLPFLMSFIWLLYQIKNTIMVFKRKI